jgi:cyanophycinase
LFVHFLETNMSMRGLIALVGSGEYLPVLDEVDRFLLGNCGADGRTPRVVCLPTAAGQEGEGSWGRWMRMGEEHFRRLGAEVTALPIIDRVSADKEKYLPVLEAADLIYFSGGNPMYLFETMDGSLAWTAAQKAWERGAAFAGCSAGAMILGQTIPNFRAGRFRGLTAFNVVPARMIFPHFDRWRMARGAMLAPLRGGLGTRGYALGVDEETALVGRLEVPEWTVMGRQTVSVITRDGMHVYKSGEKVVLGE